MHDFLTSPQQSRQHEFREFARRQVEPRAAAWDRAEQIPADVVAQLAGAGFLGSTIPARYDGQGWDTVTFGLLHEAIGRSSPALNDLLTVQAMVSMTIVKWGTDAQKARWLPPLARGEIIGAYALTEPGGGSALQSLQTKFVEAGHGNRFHLTGHKTWISFGQTAGVFLVIGNLGAAPLACLVPGRRRLAV